MTGAARTEGASQLPCPSEGFGNSFVSGFSVSFIRCLRVSVGSRQGKRELSISARVWGKFEEDRKDHSNLELSLCTPLASRLPSVQNS